MKICKYELTIGGHNFLPMLRGAEVLSVISQHNKVVLYTLENTSVTDIAHREFRVIATGGEVGEFEDFIGTVSLDSGNFIAHVFEVE